MDFSARADIEAPIEYVFGRVTDLSSFERTIMRRGGDVDRLRGSDVAEKGTEWRVKFRLRGKERAVDAAISKVEAPNALAVDVRSTNVDGEMTVDLVALSKSRTRIIVWAGATAKTIPAKLLFQSVRFARAKTQAKFDAMVENYAKDVEARYKA